MQPWPLRVRASSAEMMPITDHKPVPMSTMAVPTRTGGRPSSPVTLIRPPNACISGS